jgi:DNA invertase Pin-like site-specific DNA recombinase
MARALGFGSGSIVRNWSAKNLLGMEEISLAPPRFYSKEKAMLAKSPKRAALYVRVSTDKQTVANQIEALTTIAEGRSWTIIETYSDVGISGAKSRRDRPGLDRMLNDASHGKFDVVMAWAIDRIGRSLIDLLGTIQHLEACNVDIVFDQQNLDTTVPLGKCMFAIAGAFAEFERGMFTQRVHAGLARARKAGKTLGRPEGAIGKGLDAKRAKAKALLGEGVGIVRTAKMVGLGTGTVHRIKQGMAASA